MLIKEIMKTDVTECTEDIPVEDVYDLIQQCPNNYVVVIDSGQHRVPIGVVNEHSICENLIKQSRSTKDLFAGSVMSSKILRVSENEQVEKCRDLIAREADAIVVVNDRRQFRGVVDPVEIRDSIRHDETTRRGGSVFSKMIGKAISSSVEIPSFGWLK